MQSGDSEPEKHLPHNLNIVPESEAVRITTIANYNNHTTDNSHNDGVNTNDIYHKGDANSYLNTTNIEKAHTNLHCCMNNNDDDNSLREFVLDSHHPDPRRE